MIRSLPSCPLCPWFESVAAFIIVLATLLSYAVGWAIGVPVLLPILNTVASFPFMVLALRKGESSPRRGAC